MSTPVADASARTVTWNNTTYVMRPLDEDEFTALVDGVPVGRVLFSFGAAVGLPEGDAISEEDLTAMAEVWFAAIAT